MDAILLFADLKGSLTAFKDLFHRLLDRFTVNRADAIGIYPSLTLIGLQNNDQFCIAGNRDIGAVIIIGKTAFFETSNAFKYFSADCWA